MSKEILQTDGLKIKAGELELVRGLTFNLNAGKTLGIVGESGSGKSLTSLSVMGLIPPTLRVQGKILYQGKDLLQKSEEDYQSLRGKDISIIFQEPMSALNPSMRCGTQVAEVLGVHTSLIKKEIKAEVLSLFRKVKLPRPEEIFKSYPHQISGGQKQRVMIAMAIACKPKLLIADEPTTALDVTVQADILRLLKDLQDEFGMAMIFVTHDLGVVRKVADEVLVMYRGDMMEYGPSEEIFRTPRHPYTRGLLACRPTATTNFKRLPLVSDFLKNQNFNPPERENRSESRSSNPNLLIEVRDLFKWFRQEKGFLVRREEVVKAVDGVSFDIYRGETLGLVGESGCGKTTLGRILSGLEQADKGQIRYKSKDISRMNASEWKALHREVQIIFQDPFSSLNPRLKMGEAIKEVLEVHGIAHGKSAKAKVDELLEKVGLMPEHYNRYPHEFSGGQRQRAGIARALALQPEFIVCDESVSALDVSVQAQIINLLNDLKQDFGFTYLFISHDLAVVKYISDRIMVMKEGKLLETGTSEEIYDRPSQEYTRKLIAAVPGA